jgi:hypothetical protein
MDKSAFTIKEHVISMWVHREEWNSEMYDEMAVTFVLYFKKAA